MEGDISEVEILTKLEAISIIKDNNTEVDYFLFDEFEVHLNSIPPGSKQEWHYHEVIEEVLVVTTGQVIIKWKEGENIIDKVLKKGSVARVKKSIHTIENATEEWAEFVVFRMVPSGESKREIIKEDKVIVEI